MNQHDRVARFTVAVFRVDGLVFQAGKLEIILMPHGFEHAVEQVQIEKRHPPAQQEQHPPDHAQVLGGEQHAEKAVDEQRAHQRHEKQQVRGEEYPVRRGAQRRDRAVQRARRQKKRVKRHFRQDHKKCHKQQLVAAEQRAQAVRRPLGAPRTDMEPKIVRQQAEQQRQRQPVGRWRQRFQQREVCQHEHQQHPQKAFAVLHRLSFPLARPVYHKMLQKKSREAVNGHPAAGASAYIRSSSL